MDSDKSLHCLSETMIYGSRNSADFDNIDYYLRLYLHYTTKSFVNSLHDFDELLLIRVKLKQAGICYQSKGLHTMLATKVQTITDNCKLNVWITILGTVLMLFIAKYIHSGILILTSLLLSLLISIALHRQAKSNHPLVVSTIIYLIIAIMVTLDAFIGTDIPTFHSYPLCMVKDNS